MQDIQYTYMCFENYDKLHEYLLNIYMHIYIYPSICKDIYVYISFEGGSNLGLLKNPARSSGTLNTFFSFWNGGIRIFLDISTKLETSITNFSGILTPTGTSLGPNPSLQILPNP